MRHALGHLTEKGWGERMEEEGEEAGATAVKKWEEGGSGERVKRRQEVRRQRRWQNSEKGGGRGRGSTRLNTDGIL